MTLGEVGGEEDPRLRRISFFVGGDLGKSRETCDSGPFSWGSEISNFGPGLAQKGPVTCPFLRFFALHGFCSAADGPVLRGVP